MGVHSCFSLSHALVTGSGFSIGQREVQFWDYKSTYLTTDVLGCARMAVRRRCASRGVVRTCPAVLRAATTADRFRVRGPRHERWLLRRRLHAGCGAVLWRRERPFSFSCAAQARGGGAAHVLPAGALGTWIADAGRCLRLSGAHQSRARPWTGELCVGSHAALRDAEGERATMLGRCRHHFAKACQ